MWIMIAGPYRTGAKSEAERERNLRALNRAAYELFRRGHVPIIGVNCALPMIEAAGPDEYDSIMMPLSLALADRCDAILRLEGHSPGADDEVERVRRRGGVAYHSVVEVPNADGARAAPTPRSGPAASVVGPRITERRVMRRRKMRRAAQVCIGAAALALLTALAFPVGSPAAATVVLAVLACVGGALTVFWRLTEQPREVVVREVVGRWRAPVVH